MEILTSILTSTFVSGVFAFVFKEMLKTRLDSMKRKIETVIAYQSKDFDATREEVSKIWSSFSKLDDYFSYELSKEIESGKLSNETFRKYSLDIRTRMALLPENLYEACDNMLNDISESFNESMRNISALTKEYLPTQSEFSLEKANKELEDLREFSRSQLLNLRTLFREYITEHIQKS
ncbi:hypothetical protein [Pectobacterium brasiliense]|uniref:hypothetical protein n=1 Tax=Pectobacterium brasiliense TaxID=180957 RepID=UPI0019693736|nr:hypothetical protein [Pectobacterium brasiliense]MBN3133278.1 hypothetical protein [Pectobacterium brasiliense]